MKKCLLSCFFASIVFFASCSSNEDPPTEPTPDPREEPKTPYVPLKTYYPAQISITTEENKIIDEDGIKATIVIDSCAEDGTLLKTLYNGATEIHLRGHSTREYLKKPYKLKLSKKTAFFDMPENKHWVLLANHLDRTLLRNELIFEISRMMEFPYTARSRYADVTLNGVPIGSYQLVEHMRVGKNRVDVAEIAADATHISGGYLLEIDQTKGEPAWFVTQQTEMIVCVKSPDPENIPINQLNYIKNHVQQAEDILFGANGVNVVAEFPKYVDMNSFIDYYLINELSKNVDGNLRRSTYLYKQQDDNKLYFGPVWDYDITFGNSPIEGLAVEGWYARQAPWYQKFFAHPEFNKMVVDRWRELRKSRITTTNLNAFIDETVRKIDRSQKQNFQIWDILNSDQYWPDYTARGTYENELIFLKDWIDKRIKWMDSQL